MLRFFVLTLVLCATGCGDDSSPPVSVPAAQQPDTTAETEQQPVEPEPETAGVESPPSSESETATNESAAEVIEMTAVEWSDTRKERGYDMSHLNGKRIRLSGVVGNVDLDLAEMKVPAVTFRTGDGFWFGVECCVPGRLLWDAVRPNQQVALEYTHFDDSGTHPKNCRVVSVEGDAAPVIEAQDLVDAYTKNKEEVDQKYIMDYKSRRVGLAGKVREVIRPEVGPILVVFETQSDMPVTADMASEVAKLIQLPTAGQHFRVWGSYSSYTAPEDGEEINLYTHSLGVVSAVPFPASEP